MQDYCWRASREDAARAKEETAMAPATWLLVVLLAAPQAPAAEQAQPPAAKPAEEAKQEEKVDAEQRYHEELVVTATRYEQDSYNSPASISVISVEDLSRARPEKMMDLLKREPGLEVAGEGPFRGLPVIRGLSSNRVLILVDGQRLNNGRESTQFAGTQPGLVDLGEVERVEVLRGPASVLYGSDALGGVVNIITKQSDFQPAGFKWSGLLSGDYGTAADSQRYRAEIGGAGARASFRLGGTFFSAEDYESPEGVVPNSGMESSAGDAHARFLLSDRSLLRADVEVYRGKDIGFPGYDPATSGVTILFPNFDRDKLGVTYELSEWAGLTGLTLSAYAQSIDKQSVRNLRFGRFFSDNFTQSLIDSLGANAQARAALGRHSLTFGLDWYRDDLDDTTVAESIFGSSNDVAVPLSRQSGLGAYLQDEFPLGSSVFAVVGVRGDSFIFESFDDPEYKGEPFDESTSAMSGNLGVRWEVTNHVQLTGTIGRGFRAPNIQERSFYGLVSTGDTFFVQNPDLDPEISLNYEAGFKVRYPRYSGGLSVYYNDLTDFIGFEFTGTDPETGLALGRLANIAAATIYGAEFQLETFLGEAWTVFTTLAYSRGEDDTLNQPLDFIPPPKAIVGARYQVPRWWVEGSIRIVDNQDRVPTLPEPGTPSPGFTTYDLRGGFDLGVGFTVQAAVENLSDKAYAEPFNIRLEPGRNVRVSVGYKF
jgi:hemoglobin/transferrin/lactoferrin receptor protein